MSDLGLASLPVFDGCSPEALDDLRRHLEHRHLEPGERLMTQGEPGRFFAIVVRGDASVVREGPGGSRRLAIAGAGSIVGELALLRGRGRMATVTAETPLDVLTGDARAFEMLLDLPGVHERIRRLVSARLAEDVTPVPATLRSGEAVLLRPLLPSDRAAVVSAVREMSEQSLRRRFFTGGQPSKRMLDYLIEIDYVDHFAWLVLDGRDPLAGLATCRYIRSHDDPEQAEVAFAVKDHVQGHGIGTFLLGAIAAAASVTGIRRFTASLLTDNLPMKAVLAKAGATFAFAEPGITAADLAVADALSLLDEPMRDALQGAARDVVTAAGLALARAAPAPS